MEKLIDLLASGESIKVDNQLLCDVKAFNYTLQNGKVYDDSITIYNERDLLIEGNAYSSSFRVKIKNKSLNDRRVKIDFQRYLLLFQSYNVLHQSLPFQNND